MATIGISGSYGGLNIGDEAILASMLASLREARPDDEFVVFSRNAAHTREHQDADRVVGARRAYREEVAPEIERLDLLLLGGGGILYDEEARVYLRDVRLGQEHGVPTFAFAVGVGPLEDLEDRQLVRETVEAMDGVTVRDEESKRLLEDVGVKRPIEVTADPALLLTPQPFDGQLLRREGIDSLASRVGISVREPGRAASDLDQEHYHAVLAHAADFIVHRFNADVVFVPMERVDIRHAHAVIGHMTAADRGQVLKGHYGPRQLLGLMDHLDLVMGMRLHILIFAALAGVPFLPLPYAGKVWSFTEAVGMHAPAGAEVESVGPLLAELDRLWDARDERRDELRQAVQVLQERARKTIDLALAHLPDDDRQSRPRQPVS
jgi:polysaccharide pyruvyl transferase CsaB